MLTRHLKINTLFHGDGIRQMMVNAISSILNGYNAVSFTPGYHGNRLTAVTPQGKQEGIEFFIISIDMTDPVFPTQVCVHQVHAITSD
jgi:hypothetical protein